VNLISDFVTHLECICRFYLRDCLFTWWRKQ